MKPTIFITGAGGFAGNQLLAKLDISRYRKIYCLELKQENVQIPASIPSDIIEVVEGNLMDPSTYQEKLKEVDSVIHLAALTGKANPGDYFKINAYGTMLLLDRCKEAGVKNFLFISSIAVAFKNKHRYFYAHSKEQAENYVKNSGLNYTILRPTMIMGKGSPVFEGLSRLAGLPVIPMFGKGETLIQPISVEDIAKALRQVEESSRYDGEILEIGGPENISIEDFLKRIAQARGKENPHVLHLPVGLIAFFLSLLEPLVYGLLPMTVGQLASFRNDGVAESNSLFTKYLVRQSPNNYILEKYNECHQKLDLLPVDFFDSLLLKLAKLRPLFTRTADGYSRFFRPTSSVRKRLAYLAAILEVSPPYFRFYDSADGEGKVGFFLKAAIRGAGLAFHLLLSFPFLFPLQIISKLTGKRTSGRPAAESFDEMEAATE